MRLYCAYGPALAGRRLVAFDDRTRAAGLDRPGARGRWRADGGRLVDVAVRSIPGRGKALRSDLRQARLLRTGVARSPG